MTLPHRCPRSCPRALLTSTPEGRTGHLDEDLRNVDAILEQAARTLDFTRPVALMLLGVVIFLDDDEDPYGVVRRLLDALAPGSVRTGPQVLTRSAPSARGPHRILNPVNMNTARHV